MIKTILLSILTFTLTFAEESNNVDKTDTLLKHKSWVFTPKVLRRDIFYDREQVLEIRIAAERNRKEQAEDEAKEEDLELDSHAVPADLDNWLEAEERANKYVSELEILESASKNNSVIKLASTGILFLKNLKSEFKDKKKELDAFVSRLEKYRVRAEDAKLKEEAKVEFNNKAISVEGILWSDEQEPMAIINDQQYVIGEIIKACTIVNINDNRVDFMIVHMSRRFTFQLYVGNKTFSENK